MTNDKASIILKINGWGFTDGELKEATTKAVEALEKQTPKRPNIDSEFYPCCPNLQCTRQFHYKYKFCPECGQALDWSEVEE